MASIFINRKQATKIICTLHLVNLCVFLASIFCRFVHFFRLCNFQSTSQEKNSVAQIVFRCLAHSNKSFLIFFCSLSLNVNLIWRHHQSLLTRTTKKSSFFLHSRVHHNPFMLYDGRKSICKSSGEQIGF